VTRIALPRLALLVLFILALAAALTGCSQPTAPPTPDTPATITAIARRAVATARAGATAATTETPEPTYTPWPTWTPRPSATPRPTSTPFASETPTPMPFPTAAPVPTRVPIPTPRPTANLAQAIYVNLDLKGKILFWTSDRLWKQGERVYVMNADGSGQIPLSNNVILDSLVYGYYADLETVTADGQWRLIVQDTGPGQTGIVIRNVEDQRIRKVTVGPAFNYEPAWSPETDWIAFVSQRDGNDEIYVVDPDGRNPVRLTFTAPDWDRHPSWSPDGRRIVFWSNRQTGHKQIWVMDAEGNNPVNLSNGDFDDWDPIWVK
jgi:hypothetical protein